MQTCLMQPDHDVDLFLEATLADLIYIWRGDLSLAQALSAERLRAQGAAKARRARAKWLAISSPAHMRSARADARVV